jgi:hypothetical protein
MPIVSIFTPIYWPGVFAGYLYITAPAGFVNSKMIISNRFVITIR